MRATVPAELRFEPRPHGGDATCQLNLGGQRMVLRQCRPPSLSSEALAALAGRYENTEIDSRHAVRVEGGALRIQYGADPSMTYVMESVAPDISLVRPRAPGVAHRHVFRFERTPDGRVVSAVVTMERLKGVRLWSEGR